MRLAKSLLLIFSLSLILVACNRPPDLSNIPLIEFENIEYQIPNPGDPLAAINTLRLSIKIEDGDGDLGLGADDNDFIYEPYHLVFNNDGEPVQFGERAQDPLIFTCLEYVDEARENLDLNNDQDFTDTLKIDFNENQYNIFVDFFRKKSDGEFEEIDFRKFTSSGTFTDNTLCNTNYYGRFPCLSSEDEPCDYITRNNRPITGTLNYDMTPATFFLPLFRTDTLKLEIQIQDRALNKSNIIETPEFTLQSIQVEVGGS